MFASHADLNLLSDCPFSQSQCGEVDQRFSRAKIHRRRGTSKRPLVQSLDSAETTLHALLQTEVVDSLHERLHLGGQLHQQDLCIR